MDYKKLSIESWDNINTNVDAISGYRATCLAISDNIQSNLYIFKDENGLHHFVIAVTDFESKVLGNSRLNGLHVSLAKYRQGDSVKPVIDLKCNLFNFNEEFTKVVKEITKIILEDSGEPFETVNKVIRNWRAFWSRENKKILSEEEQIGLMCELMILKKLGEVNPELALNSWKGPFGQKHDFIFADWSVEIKGSRSINHTHTINGIDQLKPIEGKRLAFVSFMVINSSNQESKSLPELIDEIVFTVFKQYSDLVVKFFDTLDRTGYNPMFNDDYRNFKIEILESFFFEVVNEFPSLTAKNMIAPLSQRISNIRYDLSLQGLPSIELEKINWGEYF